ncbi:MAG TPA: hypothetical protein VN698_11280 [Bacteroidia bacterium]|nr:hypothetical protein [Bacteroidia bacterium]
MKKIFSLLLLFMFVNIAVFSQDTLAYKADKVTSNVVYSNNTVKIFAGQKISISLNTKTGVKLIGKEESKLTDISKISTNVLKQNSESDIVIDYNIIKQDDGKLITFLIVNNPYKKPMSYKVKMYSQKRNAFVDTDVLDVQPGISGVENWPYAIPSFVLYDFTVKE